jgi:O-antigen ligase
MERIGIENKQGSVNFALQNRLYTLGALSVVGLTLAIPTSTAATNGFMLLIVLSFALTGAWRDKWTFIRSHPLIPCVLGLFFLFLLGTQWSVGTSKQILHGLSDQSKLLYFPILLWFLREETVAKRVIGALILVMFVTYIFGLLKFYLDVPIGQKYSEAAVFKNHIKTNFFMAFGLFLACHSAVNYPKLRPMLFVTIACMLHYGYFMSMGRTGYILMLLLVLLFAFQRFRFKGVVVAGAILAALIGLSFTLSHTFHERISDISCEMMDHPENAPACISSEVVLSNTPTSIEYRRDFIITSWEAISKRFWFGYGTGGFTKAYEEAAKKLGTYSTDNPHNEYLHIWVELGVVGFIWFIFFFIAQLVTLHRYPTQNRYIAEGVLVGFLVGCLANSWLLDFSEIHFWMLLLALGTRKYHANV